MIAMLAHSVNEKGQKETALANATFIVASPVMAEVLAKYRSDLLWRAENVLTPEDSEWAKAAAAEMESALLAAGYTLKD